MRNSVVLCLGALLFLPLFGAEHEQAGAKRGPRDVLWRLRQGNIAFVAGRQSVAQVTPARRVSLVAAQRPHAVVLTCADSRVPPEYIFNEGLGLFQRFDIDFHRFPAVGTHHGEGFQVHASAPPDAGVLPSSTWRPHRFLCKTFLIQGNRPVCDLSATPMG